jgi:TPP-dependent 2-oxoacid decarboxylase
MTIGIYATDLTSPIERTHTTRLDLIIHHDSLRVDSQLEKFYDRVTKLRSLERGTQQLTIGLTSISGTVLDSLLQPVKSKFTKSVSDENFGRLDIRQKCRSVEL